MKKLLILLSSLSQFCGCTQPEPVSGTRAAAIVAEIHNPSSKNVVVACHRGDWRNWPENSLAAIESVIGMGADIMELDLKLTKDSVLVVCHDRTIDRTTSGKGRVCDITYDSIRRCVLKTGHGVKTTHRMPTLREALEVCKDRIVVNVDQGYEYYDLVLAVTEELGVTEQILIKGKRSTDVVAAKFSEHPRNMMYMPIIDILKPKGQALFAEYRDKGITPLAYEVCWSEYTPEVKECMDKVVASGSKLWV
ncbi:glycerophosphodiester phosphodiesterase family protein, partial [Alistipes sp.]|uniref:glycerophosphodiester phosphodiesterase family protein n=1 Tax=Alistipes sp. TaxID=1872444 RepID=UPI003AF029D9